MARERSTPPWSSGREGWAHEPVSRVLTAHSKRARDQQQLLQPARQAQNRKQIRKSPGEESALTWGRGRPGWDPCGRCTAGTSREQPGLTLTALLGI